MRTVPVQGYALMIPQRKKRWHTAREEEEEEQRVDVEIAWQGRRQQWRRVGHLAYMALMLTALAQLWMWQRVAVQWWWWRQRKRCRGCKVRPRPSRRHGGADSMGHEDSHLFSDQEPSNACWCQPQNGDKNLNVHEVLIPVFLPPKRKGKDNKVWFLIPQILLGMEAAMSSLSIL